MVLLWFLLLLLPAVFAFTIDNEVVGEPKVDCEDTMVALTFKTRKPFTGRVYVEGLSDDDRCARTFAQNTNQSSFAMLVQNGDCTMQRHRVSGKIEGVMFSLTIVVSFHGTFVTKADRAYRCMCFFRSTRRLTNAIEIESIGTTELLDTARMPTCSYGIRMGAPDGPPVVYGQVGDKIFHVWECDDMSQGMLVHSCVVTDGRGFKFDLLDVDGCAIDPLIQPDLTYDTHLQRAYTETWGYKFSDTAALNYECVIELCKKENGECDSFAPPMCGRSKRSADAEIIIPRRAIRQNTDASKFVYRYPPSSHKRDRQTVDVLASINMIETIKEKKVGEDISVWENVTIEADSQPLLDLKSIMTNPVVCVSPTIIVIVAAGIIAFLITTIMIACHLSRRRVYKIYP